MLRAAMVCTLGLMLITGLFYPMAVTGLCQLALAAQANGSVLHAPSGAVTGSRWIGQSFARPENFWPRPSSAGNGYDPQASSPSNLGPTSRKLADALAAEAVKARGEGLRGPLPADRLTGSGSGLDPDISLDNALGQAPRIAKARGLKLDAVTNLVHTHTQGRSFGLWGEPRVNVLEMNLELANQAPSSAH